MIEILLFVQNDSERFRMTMNIRMTSVILSKAKDL